MLRLLLSAPSEGQVATFTLSDFWQKAIIAIIAVILGFLGNYLLDRRKARREPTKRLSYDLEVRSGISAIPPDLRERIQVVYGGRVVTNSLYDVSCVLRNSGNRVIKHQFIRFQFPEGTHILDVLHEDTPEIGITEDARGASDRQRRYSFGHLERGQETHVRFIVTATSPPTPKLIPHNDEGDVELSPGTVARVAADVEHIRDLTVILLTYWLVTSTIGGFYPFGDAAVALAGIIAITLAAPHLRPVGRVLSSVAHKYLSEEARAEGVVFQGHVEAHDIAITGVNGHIYQVPSPARGPDPDIETDTDEPDLPNTSSDVQDSVSAQSTNSKA